MGLGPVPASQLPTHSQAEGKETNRSIEHLRGGGVDRGKENGDGDATNSTAAPSTGRGYPGFFISPRKMHTPPQPTAMTLFRVDVPCTFTSSLFIPNRHRLRIRYIHIRTYTQCSPSQYKPRRALVATVKIDSACSPIFLALVDGNNACAKRNRTATILAPWQCRWTSEERRPCRANKMAPRLDAWGPECNDNRALFRF